MDFVDGNLVVDDSGVKPIETVPYKVAHLSAGTHVIDVFYADRHTTNAALEFTPQFTITPVAPPTFAPTPAPIVKQLRAHRRVRIYGIHFAVGRATIEPQSQRVIAQIAQVMKQNPSWRFRYYRRKQGAQPARGARPPLSTELIRRTPKARPSVRAVILAPRCITEECLATQDNSTRGEGACRRYDRPRP